MSALLDDLAGVGDLVVDPEILETYRRDQAAPALLRAGFPAALPRPRTTAQVQVAVRVAVAHGAPVVARGAGSGLSGGANAIDGCVIVCLERMTEIIDLDPASLVARVRPGVINQALRDAAAEHDHWYAPDPASAEFLDARWQHRNQRRRLVLRQIWRDRDAVLDLEVVLADGRAVRLGHRTRKGVAGYDLTSLIVGCEGTLGIVTEATLRPQPRPPSAATLAASFPSLNGAGTAVPAIVREIVPSLLEIMDAATVRAIEILHPMGLDLEAAAYVYARSDAGGHQAVADIERMSELCERAGASLVVATDEEAEGRLVMAARRLAYPALERAGSTILDDVCVPVGCLPQLLDGIASIARRRSVLIDTFGHAGDGNMHPTIVYDSADDDAVQSAQAAFDDIVRLALELGGAVTGEHRVGMLKQHLIDDELGASAALHRTVRTALDPHGILNPGRAI